MGFVVEALRRVSYVGSDKALHRGKEGTWGNGGSE